jgi:hypothetical protein
MVDNPSSGMSARIHRTFLCTLLLTTTVAAACKPCTLWDSSSVPAMADSGPDQGVEVGIKFRADANGAVSAIRFYKCSANAGPHEVRLWTVAGAMLASATSSNETAFGWQQVDLPAPVTIIGGVTYVASYHASAGHYSFTTQYFAEAGVDRPPLHAPSNKDGGNGVYAYSPTSAFPSSSNNSPNYWVDVVFTPSEAALVSIAVEPAKAAVVAGSAERFTAIGKYSDGTTQDLAGLATWEASNPGIATAGMYGMAMGVSGGETTITARLKSVAATAALAVRAGPGESPAPLLVVTSAGNPFTAYVPEILRAEGLNEFDVLDVAQLTGSVLSRYDLAILGDMSLTSTHAATITAWVQGGGNLIAMHPDKQLAGLLGLAPAGGQLSEGYLQINTTTGPGVGLVAEPIQFHGAADRYQLKGATSFATLYSARSSATSNPAVTLNTAGRGRAAAFTYDLARSVVYTRQGNPAWSGQMRDPSRPLRTFQLFFGNAREDPKPDWVDFANIAIPQADEQQRLLVNLILQMITASKPLPRFWYLPRGLKAVVVMTGDDHGSRYAAENGNTAPRFGQFLIASRPDCKLENWECVRASAYLFPPAVASNPLLPEQAADAVARGFEVGLHLNSVPDCADWTASSLDAIYAGQWNSFSTRYPGVPPPQTGRTHCVSWSDYDSQPQVERKHGIRLDTNYYYYPKPWVNNRPGLFTGSGMPMRFATRTGVVIDVYQATTQMTDESGQTYPLTINTLLDNALGPLGYYGAFTANMHADVANSADAQAILAAAQTRGVPIISALQLLQWLEGRNGSFFSALAWKENTLTFKVTVAAGSNGIDVMLPAEGPSGRLAAITCDKNAVPYTTLVVKGIEYAIFPAGVGGTFQAAYGAPPARN